MSKRPEGHRIASRRWYSHLMNSMSLCAQHAHWLKKRGWSYCQIMDYFAGKGYK